MIPSWAGIRALISSVKVPEIHVDFLFVLPKPVTEYSTIYRSMLNFEKMLTQLNFKVLPLF